jgi:hypothetical protein
MNFQNKCPKCQQKANKPKGSGKIYQCPSCQTNLTMARDWPKTIIMFFVGGIAGGVGAMLSGGRATLPMVVGLGIGVSWVGGKSPVLAGEEAQKV